jgi:hypothetical protein
MTWKSLAIAFVAGILAAGSAQAREVRYPASGTPAFVFQVPDDWNTRLDSSNNMIVGTADHSGGFSFSLIEYSESIETAAPIILKSAGAVGVTKLGPAHIGPCKGFDYFGTITNSTGAQISVHLVIVRVDSTHVATATLIGVLSSTQEQRKATQVVLEGAQIVP